MDVKNTFSSPEGGVSKKSKKAVDVSSILKKYEEGASKEYDHFVSQIQDPMIKEDVLAASLHGLKLCVYQLNQRYEALIGVILKIVWLNKTAAVIKEYQSFLVNLISAHSVYVSTCMRMLIKYFMPQIEATEDKEIDMKLRAKHQQMFIEVHKVIKAVNHIVPMTPTVLLPLLAEYFPYMGKHPYLQECYAMNLLQVTSYLPEQRSKILELLVERMTKLDVRSPRQDIEDADYKSDNEDDDDDDMEQDIFDMASTK